MMIGLILGVLRKAHGTLTVQGSARHWLSQFNQMVCWKVRQEFMILFPTRGMLLNPYNACNTITHKSDGSRQRWFYRSNAQNKKRTKRSKVIDSNNGDNDEEKFKRTTSGHTQSGSFFHSNNDNNKNNEDEKKIFAWQKNFIRDKA
jgi:hypothetical protein